MRKRFQNGSIRKKNRAWIGRWYENGQRRSRRLGPISETKSEARDKLAAILRPINARTQSVDVTWTFGQFIKEVFLPFSRRKWKPSTEMTDADRIQHHLVGEFGALKLSEVSREQMQNFLERKAAKLSFSTVDHLKWDLVAIFRLAHAEGHILRNPAQPKLLFTPPGCKVGMKRVMEKKEVSELLKLFELRERLILKFAVLAGMRPGEIFGLRRGDLTNTSANISRRVYRGKIDTPKTRKSVRLAGLPGGLGLDLAAWLEQSPTVDPDGWLFPSERLTTPLRPDGVWRRHIRPTLNENGFSWVNFQVLRRTASSVMDEEKVDPKVRADQLGHTLEVNVNTYTQTSLERRIQATEVLEAAVVN
jgi:integrase